jgi:hypothetical protein
VQVLQAAAAPGFEPYRWLNRLYQYLVTSKNKTYIGLFSRSAIIPNYQGTFLSLECGELAIGQDLTTEALDCIARLGNDMFGRLVHSSITTLGGIVQEVINPAELSQIIDDRVQYVLGSQSPLKVGLDKIWPLMRLSPATEKCSQSFCQSQTQLLSCLAPFAPVQERSVKAVALCDTAWKTARRWCLGRLVQYVEKAGYIDNLQLGASMNPIKWLDTLCAILRDERSQAELDTFLIFPDQQGVFHCSDDHSMDEIPAAF